MVIDVRTHRDFPSYEYIKSLPLNKEYRWIIFETGILGVNGILTWNEDYSKKFFFDVTIGGYTGESKLDKVFPGNKEGYKKMCSYVFDVYKDILWNLSKDMSWQWNNKER